MEGEGSSSEMEFTEVETNTDSVDNSVIFRVTKSVIGFVLYMHQQIPSYLSSNSPNSKFFSFQLPIRLL
jgi:hypothetical protein